MEAEIDDFYFTSKFDSGNLAKVQSIKFFGTNTSNSPDNVSELYPNLRPEYRFHLWTKPDAAGTAYENSNRTWFHFAVQTRRRSCVVQYVLQNLNKQMRLYAQGMAPVFSNKPGSDEYERIPHQPWFWVVFWIFGRDLDGEQFYMSFIHVTPASSSVFTYFAFTYPYSYEKLQRYLGGLDQRFSHCRYLTEKSAKDQIYYSREFVCYSLEGKNIDLLTISSCHGMTKTREPYLTCLFPKKSPRPFFSKENGWFAQLYLRNVVFLSARVHPGETPSSYVLHGFLDFILSDSEFLAYKLRKRYICLQNNPNAKPRRRLDGPLPHRLPRRQPQPRLRRPHLRTTPLHLCRQIPHPLLPRGQPQEIKLPFTPPVARRLTKKTTKPPKSPITTTTTNTTTTSKLEIIGKALHDEIVSVPGPSAHHDPSGIVARSLPAVLNPLSTTISSLKAFKTCLERRSAVMEAEEKFGINFQPEVVRLAIPELEVEPGPSWIMEKKPDLPVAEEIPPVPELGMFESFNEEWSSFVTSVLKIRGELSQTLKELQETFSLTLTENSPRSVAGADVEPVRRAEEEGEESGGDNPSDSAGSEPGKSTEFYGTHLVVPDFCAQIGTAESGIALYVDMHGHASRRGCFMYGNHFDDLEEKVDSMVLPKLLSINCPFFDFMSCVFTKKNMFSADRKDGTSKLGCGRVAIHTMTKITRCYTLECNYNTGVMSSAFSARNSACIMQSSIPPQSTYKPQVYEQVGRSLAVTILDTEDTLRSGSRMVLGECRSMPGVRDWLRTYIRQSESKVGVRASSPKARQATSTATIAVPRRKQQAHRRKPFANRNASRRHSTANKSHLIELDTSSMAEFVRNMGSKKANPGGDDESKRTLVKPKKASSKRKSATSTELTAKTKLRLNKSTTTTSACGGPSNVGGGGGPLKNKAKTSRKKSPTQILKRTKSSRLSQDNVGHI
uniref:Uncharacterized protein n=1 Tax=Strigamia maritima TaxID=126957 RepID=T1JM20_STRMM